MYKPVRVAVLLLLLTAATAALASGVNGINNGMPNRISMNVTVPKQTQVRGTTAARTRLLK
jgi:hypothetical protein